MKRSRFASLFFLSAMMFFLASCGDGGSDKQAATDSASMDTSAATVAPPVVNTTITTPQSMLVVISKTSNFAKWKVAFDDHDSARLASGVHRYVVGRGMKDSMMIFVALKVDDIAKAKAFAKDPGLKKAMQKGGAMGKPMFYFSTVTFQDTVAISTTLRSMTTFTVKDWTAWEKSFEEGKQERIDNGLTVRAIGHDEADDKKVVLVTAITDTAKAFAYYKSDLLKKRRAESGATSEPVRFLFNVVQRY